MGKKVCCKLLLAAAMTLLLSLLSLPALAGDGHQAVFVIGQNTYVSDGRTAAMDVAPYVENGRTFVPVRYLALSLGVAEDKIIWNPSDQTVTLVKDGTSIMLAVGENIIYINGRPEEIDAVPALKDGRVFLPARRVAEALGYEVAWNGAVQAVLVGSPGNLPELPPAFSWKTRYEQREVETSAGIKTANLVYVNMNNPAMELRPVMAEDRVGRVEELASMAARTGAVAAINGTFFNAYDANDLMPQGTLGANYSYYHLGSNATLGVDDRNRVYIGQLTPYVEGGTDGSWEWPNWWYAWGINHYYSPDGIVVFTPEYKYDTTPPGRTAVVVRNGIVTGIRSGQVEIPEDGYVIWYGENNYERDDQFSAGRQVDYRVTFKENQQARFKAAISNYPLLLSNGAIALGDITEPKLTIGAPRSFVGVTWDNILVMGTVDSANVWELAEVTKNLGLKDALNLDGGASCGLYYDGAYIRQPGRLLSNCLVVIQ